MKKLSLLVMLFSFSCADRLPPDTTDALADETAEVDDEAAARSTCGNGRKEGVEQCDDGNRRGGDGCSRTCKVESGWTCPGPHSGCAPICGDGQKRGNEECDDGNQEVGDGCDDQCETEVE